MTTKKWNFKIFHLATDMSYEVPMKCLQLAAHRIPHRISKPAVYSMFEVQYNEFRLKASRKFKYISDKRSNVLIFGNKRYMNIEQLLQLLRDESSPIMILNQNMYETSWTSHLLNPNIVNPQRDYIFFNVNIRGKNSGYLILEIYTDIEPKMCKKFIEIFKRDVVSLGHIKVFKDGWLEFGINPRLNQVRTKSKIDLSHNSRGVFSFSNDVKFDCDAYFIHFVPCQFFDQYRTVIGRVIHGDSTLHEIEQIETNFGTPITDISITTCGIVPIGRNIPPTFDYTDWNRSLQYLFFPMDKKFMRPPIFSELKEEVVCPKQDEPEVVNEIHESSEQKISISSTLESTSSLSTPDTLSSFSYFDREPITLHIDDQQNGNNNIQEVIKMPLKRSYYDELSEKEKVNIKIDVESDICSIASNDVTTFLRNQDCPSIGMDVI